MNSKERVKAAITFSSPDRVPYFGILPWNSDVFPMLPLTPKSWQPKEPFMPYIHTLELKFGTWKSKRKLPKNWIKKKHAAIDEWGVIWERNGSITDLGQVIDFPVKELDRVDAFKTPDPHNPERYSLLTKLSRILGRRKYKLGSLGNFFFERYHFIRGWENSMKDIARPSRGVFDLLNKLMEYYLSIAEEWIERGVDGIIAVDDLGGQSEPLMSPRTFKKVFAPYYEKVIKLCHDNAVDFMLHSCGDIKELMPALVNIGVDVFQFDGPEQTGVEWCGEHFGGKVAFMNVVDIQKVLPRERGTLADIEKYVKKMIYYLANFNGGLIGQEYPTPRVLHAHENAYKIMRKAYKKHGMYPLNIQALQEH
ncbi:MAG: uroporphyrinogen decarboxylase family protein [Promethearchaeota archaeon]